MCPTLCRHTRLPRPWEFPGKNTGVGCYSFFRESSRPRDRTHVSCMGRRLLYLGATREALIKRELDYLVVSWKPGGAWWAAIPGVAQSRTRLKRLSSCSSRKHLPTPTSTVVHGYFGFTVKLYRKPGEAEACLRAGLCFHVSCGAERARAPCPFGLALLLEPREGNCGSSWQNPSALEALSFWLWSQNKLRLT